MVGHENARRLGWLGTGRMGVEMARRLLAAGCDLAVYNRSAAKADPLVRLGAKPAGSAAELAARDIVFVTVGTSDDLTAAVLGPHGLMSGGDGAAPAVLIDCSAVSGPREAFAIAEPYLSMLGHGVTYVGEGEAARTVKLCHNLFLGVVAQSLAEITVLAQKSGISRQAFLACQ